MGSPVAQVASYRSAPEAEVARLALEAAGIPAFLSDSEVVSMTSLLGNAVGYVKLEVAARDADAARRILDAYDAGAQSTTDSDEDLGGGGLSCLSCGGAMPEDADTCPACGWSYGQTSAPAE